MTEMKTFREAYAVLQKHAQTLRSQQEPDIDNLTTIVSESLAAHKICKERIDAVEKALEDLDRFNEASELPGRKVLAIAGLRVTEELEIGSDFVLVPFDALQSHSAKFWSDSHVESYRLRPRRDARPSAAIVQRVKFSP